jgi:hypothetical protein
MVDIWFRAAGLAALVALAGPGCSDEETPPGSDAGGDGGAGASSSSAGPGGAGGSGGGGDGGGTGGGGGCGGEVTRVIGPEGGLLENCGAHLVVPRGAVRRDTSFAIALVEDPPAPPFERVFASPVFRITPADEPLLAPAELLLDHEVARGSRFEIARYDTEADAFVGFEACTATEAAIGQRVGLLGTFAALRDVNVYPDSTTGLGDGSLDLSFLGATYALGVDDPGSYGIFASDLDGGKVVTLNLWRTVGEGIESLRIDFGVEPGGAAGSLVQVQWISTVTSLGYSFIEGLVGSGGAITVEENPEGRLVGTLEATLHGGDPPHDELLQATFDVSVERFSFPPELSCGSPEG